MNVTIKDIAKETGLSTATISKYLNNIKIREENRLLIEDSIKRLDYKPNRSAQILRSKRTMTIGILISDLGNYFWGALISFVTQFLMKHNYTVITRSYHFDIQAESDVIRDLISQNIDGVIALPNNALDNLYHMLQKAGIPVILLDQLPVDMKSHPVDCIISDNYGGSAKLATHLIKNGHHNIYILDQSVHSYTVEQRIKGFSDVFIRNGNPLCPSGNDYEPIPFIESKCVINMAKERFLSVMSCPNPPTAIFFTNYLMAMGGLKAAHAARYRIPEDVSLVCFDDDLLFKALSPSLTCVAQNLREIGVRACETLLRRIHGNYSDFPYVSTVAVEFHQRASVKNVTTTEPAI